MIEDFEVLIGSDAKRCAVCLPGTSPVEAVLRRAGDHLRIRNLGPAGTVRIGGAVLPRRGWRLLTADDEILIRGIRVTIPPDFFHARPRVDVDSTRLVARARGGDVLCDGLYVRARAGTVTAVMGPSGAGKSVLLRLLIGYDRPAEGRVLVGGRDLHRDYAAVRDAIGYVPQAEVMIPELRVRESLDYRLQLRFRSMQRAAREQIIRSTCSALGFAAQLDPFLRKRIGSPEWRGRYPSGGERRRINIAHELVGQPLVLFLDEPTSGLSSSDANGIIRLLHHLARQQGLTVLLTVHQPSVESFALFDDLLLLHRGGRMAYYGEAGRVVEYFRKISTDRSTEAVHPAEFIFEFVREPAIGDWSVAQFREAMETRRFAFLKEPLS